LVDEIKSMSIVAIRRIVVTAGLVLLLVPSPASAETSERSETTAETEVLESTGSAESLVSQDIQSDPVAVLDGTSRSEAITPEVADPVLVEPDTPETSDTPDTSDTSETPEPDESNEADESIDEAASTTEEPLPVPTDWSGRVNEIASRIRIGASEASAADALYRDLTAELWAYQDEVFEALRSRSPDALSQRDILDRMYDARMRLLEWVTPELRGTMIGGGSRGMRELGNEIENAKLDFYFQTLAIPRGLRRIADDIRDSPLDDLGRFIELLFGVIVFRVCRRWAKEGIPKTLPRMLAMRPPTDAQRRAAQPARVARSSRLCIRHLRAGRPRRSHDAAFCGHSLVPARTLRPLARRCPGIAQRRRTGQPECGPALAFASHRHCLGPLHWPESRLELALCG
jgi:hypothetical protein